MALAVAFDAIEGYLGGIGRPPTALCACELRSPGQFTDAGFVAFNRHYVERLAAWGIFRDEVNPVARSNVCPEIDPPATPSFYAFSYTVPSEDRAARSFVAAGSGEAREGGPSYEGRIIRRGDQSSEAMREKARFVLGAMEQRMAALGFGWADVTATQVYTIFDSSAPGRRDHPPRSQSGRFDVAFRAPAGAGPRFRDGCTRRRPRIRDLTRYARHQKIAARRKYCVPRV